MHVNNSFQALFQPGEAEDFFDISGLQDFHPGATGPFERTNALWLSEFSRLIYRQEKDEIPERDPNFRTRASFLAARGWQEAAFFNEKADSISDTQAGLLLQPDLKVAVLVFRGTLGSIDIITDLRFRPKEWHGRGRVHEGFSHALARVWAAITTKLAGVAFPVFFTGHSLGAALATLAAARCAHDTSMIQPAALYTFGSPRVGDAEFADSLQDVSHWRVVDQSDIVPKLPPTLNLPPYQHTGNLHQIEDSEPPQARFIEDVEMVTMFRKELRRVAEGNIDPPKFLADHAPVNYTARLELEH